jgi:hypothetical protein
MKKLFIVILLLSCSVSINRNDILLRDGQNFLPASPPCLVETDAGLLIQAGASIYHPTIGQCDSTPHITASGRHIDLQNPGKHRYVALSRNLIRNDLWHKECSGYNSQAYISFGDTIIIRDGNDFNGKWIVVDSMNKRYSDRIDFLVDYSMKGYFFTNNSVIIEI